MTGSSDVTRNGPPAGQPALALVSEALQALEAELHGEAIQACERALEQDRDSVEARFLLGLAAFELEDFTGALQLLEEAHRLAPDVQEYAEGLAAVYAQLGKVSQALFYAKLGPVLAPHPSLPGLLPARFGSFFKNLRNSRPDRYQTRAKRRLALGHTADAIADCERQLELQPGDVVTLRLLAEGCQRLGRSSRALAACQAVLHSGQATAEDFSLTAEALAAGGRFEEAMACHAAALEQTPQDPRIGSRLLATAAADPACPTQALQAAHAAWRERHEAAIVPRPAVTRNAEPNRPLNVAYLCGSFHDGDSMALFEPVLRNHDQQQVRPFCYAEGARSDVVTESLMRRCWRWNDTTAIDDETLWQILQGDEIDIVVDLSGHQTGGRPLLFTRRPAPIALSWLVHPHPPAAAAFDYVLSDERAWPACRAAISGTAAPYRMAKGHFALPLPAMLPEVGPLPAAQRGHLTFGLSCDLAQIGSAQAGLCASLLRNLPASRLLICNRFDQDQAAIDRVLELFANLGQRGRVDVVNMGDNFATGADFYHHADVALDSGSAAQVVENARALWMGVPLLSLAGDRHATRLGASLLNAAGHGEWAVEAPAQLIALAQAFDADRKSLAAHRASLRGSVAGSPLCDVTSFVRALEATYCKLWHDWCRENAG